MKKRYIRTDGAIIPYETREVQIDASGAKYLIDGSHLIEARCVVAEGDDVERLIDKVVTVGTRMGEPLEPRTFPPGALRGLIAGREAGMYALPLRIYGAIWRKGPKGNPILVTVCEFPRGDAAPEVF